MNALRKLFLVCFIAFSLEASLAQDDEFVFYSDLARDWYQGGDYFEWTSTTEDNNAKKVNVFYRTGETRQTEAGIDPRLPEF